MVWNAGIRNQSNSRLSATIESEVLMRYIVLSAVVLLDILSLIGLVNVLFGGIAKTQVQPEFGYFVTVYSSSIILLSATALLFWNRRMTAVAIFACWLGTTFVLSFWSGFKLTEILLLAIMSVLLLTIMVLDLRKGSP